MIFLLVCKYFKKYLLTISKSLNNNTFIYIITLFATCILYCRYYVLVCNNKCVKVLLIHSFTLFLLFYFIVLHYIIIIMKYIFLNTNNIIINNSILKIIHHIYEIILTRIRLTVDKYKLTTISSMNIP